MFTKLLPLTLAAGFLSVAGTSQAAVLITPVGVGTATGSSGPVEFTGMFDAQPSTIPAVGNTSGSYGSQYGYFATANTGRVGYIDFGSDYANITLETVYVELKQFGNPSTATITYWWSSSTDKNFDGTDIAQSNLGLFSTGSANSNQQWIQTWSGSVTVPHQYLVIEYTSASYGNRLGEIAFAGTVVPEPATLGLAAGAVGFLAFRRRRGLTGRC